MSGMSRKEWVKEIDGMSVGTDQKMDELQVTEEEWVAESDRMNVETNGRMDWV